MSGGVDAVKDEWVERVLGLKVAESAAAGPNNAETVLRRVRDAREAWRAAAETVDGQINGLAKALQGSGDPDLQIIAQSGLMTVTGGFRTRMMAALADLGDGDLGKLRQGGGKAAGFADKLRSTIEADERVIACDENDFGAAVSIRATLGPALAELAGALRAATKT